MSLSSKLTFAVIATLAVGIPTPSLAKSGVRAAPRAATAPDGKPAAKKLTITGLESGVTFTAQFNPKEIHVDKSVPWSKSKTSRSDQPELEFTSAEGRSMSFELAFDTFEAKTDVHAAYIAKLLALASVMDQNGAEEKKRPTRVRVQWGTGGLKFEGVIESLSIKYTMFMPDGTPVRATCSVKLKEASRATFKK